MKEDVNTIPKTPPHIKEDSYGCRYIVYPDGQLRRMSEKGTQLPRIKMSKKERLRLRKEYKKIEGMGSTELANKILETPVINPITDSELNPSTG